MIKKLCLSLLALLGLAAAAGAENIGTFSGGSGTQADPFKVTKVEDLNELATNVSVGVSTYQGYYFKMMNDIELTAGKLPVIGISNHLFQGEFDGDGHSFKNFNVTLGTNASNVGIFGWIGQYAVLKNITVDSPVMVANGNANDNATLCSNNKGLIENCHVVNASLNFVKSSSNNKNGGLVAYLPGGGRIKSSTFKGKVVTGARFGAISGVNYGGLIEGCISYADIVLTRSNIYVGGVTAVSTTTTEGIYFRDCIFRGSIKVLNASISSTQTAGICANNTTTGFEGCVNEGYLMAQNYNGGIAGWLFGKCSMSGCYNTGEVTDIFMAHDSIPASYGMNSYQGGLVGYVSEGKISKSFNVGKISSLRGAGGLCGGGENLQMTDCYNAGLINAPEVWLSGNTLIEMCGGLVGYKGGPSTYIMEFTNCLSVGSINNSPTARGEYSQYIGRQLGGSDGTGSCTFTNCYYDNQVAGWGNTSPDARTTEALTSATTLEGFNAEIWQFTAGMYPRLKMSATTDAALAGATPLFMAAGNNHSRVVADISLGTATAAKWALTGGEDAVLDGSTVKVTRGKMPDEFLLTSTVGTVARTNILTVYPNVFKGEGTAQNPYEIATYDDLKAFADVTTTGKLTFTGEYLKLTADINLNNDATFKCMSLNAGAPFMGTFDGNGHALSAWTLNNHTNSVQYGGLFGYIGETGVVKNLVIDATCKVGLYLNNGTIVGRLYGKVENCKVLPASILSKAASGDWGGIAGRVEATGSVTDCYVGSSFLLSGATSRVGGIASNNYGLIDGCQYAGSITGTAGKNLAGIAYNNTGTISNCLMSGNVVAQETVGGIVANNSGTLSNILMTGVVGYTYTVNSAAAICGNTLGTFENVVFDSQISILENFKAPGITGKLTREIIAAQYGEKWVTDGQTYPRLAKFATETAAVLTSYPVVFADTDTRLAMTEKVGAKCYAATGLTWRLEDADDFTLRSNQLSFDGWSSYCTDELKQTYSGITRIIPIGAYGSILTGKGTEAEPWLIATEADLRKVCTETNKAYNKYDYAGKHFKITADITLASNTTGISCGNARKFNGVIHGENHKISNLTINGTSYPCTGFVGYLGEKGRIENLTIESGKITGYATYVGGVTGYCTGAVENCTNKAEITTSKEYVGGVAGYVYNATSFTGNKNYGTVSSTANYVGGVAAMIYGSREATYSGFANYGAVTGMMFTGGVFGRASFVSLENMDNFAPVKAVEGKTCNIQGGVVGSADACKSITKARNFGALSGGNTAIGGVIGRYYPESDKTVVMTVSNCLNAGDVTGKANNIGGVLGMSESYPVVVENSVNTGRITCVATSVAAGTPAAGGIVAGGVPTINNCYNAGVISGVNCIGGILGRVSSNTGTFAINNCVNWGWLEGFAEASANIGSVTGYNSTNATFTGSCYDARMSNVAAVGKKDIDGCGAKATLEIVTGGRYPVPAALASDSTVMLASMPVYFTGSETRYEVTSDFKVGITEGIAWSATAPLEITGDNAVFAKQEFKGEIVLTAKYGQLSRVLPITVNLDGLSGIEDVTDNSNGTGNKPVDVYNLYGVKVLGGATPEQISTLPAGIYVAGGRKIMVK